MVNMKIRLGKRLGAGAFSTVFRAHETTSGLVVAVKKSRVSLKVKRTILCHETRILRLVAGHPSIPQVFAYAHLEHFEYLALEILGRSLGDIVKRHGPAPLQIVICIADRMISALKHIHDLGIVHRDVKPDNIMTKPGQLFTVSLIDFGIARPMVAGEPTVYDLVKEHRQLVGTITWASLNSHHGIDLGPRDDLESLAYTLLYLLRGELPWRRYTHHGTILGLMTQVREHKHAWRGPALADGFPPVFGELLEYARGLGFHEPVEYEDYRTRLSGLRQPIGDVNGAVGSGLTVSCWRDSWTPDDRESDSDGTTHTYCAGFYMLSPLNRRITTARYPESKHCTSKPGEVGQLVYVRLLARFSAEGYSIQAGDAAFWHDPDSSSDYWRTTARPAIVVSTTFDFSRSPHEIYVVPLGCGTPRTAALSDVIPVCSSAHPSTVVKQVTSKPAWPLPDTYCYAFPVKQSFFCPPSQETVPSFWTISSDDVQVLQKQFLRWSTPSLMCVQDARYQKRIKTQATEFLGQVTSLNPSSLAATVNGEPVDWKGDRGWFDECDKVARYRGLQDGELWTGARHHGPPKPPESSYFYADHSLWADIQGEGDRSLTLDSKQQELFGAVGLPGRVLEVL